MQVVRKLWRPVLASRQPLRVKLEALLHLMNNVGHPCVLLLALLLPLSYEVKLAFATWFDLALFAVCTLGVVAFYERSQRVLGRTLGRRIGDTLAAVTLGIGMSPSQTLAVIQGLLPGTGEFVRTPKAGDAAPALHYASRTSSIAGFELLRLP